MRSFEGRGALSDASTPTPPEIAVAMFEKPEDIRIDLVLSEPQVNQPLELTFDHRGRLWIVQYNQYPYPEGLKVTGIDNHLRAEFDKVPKAPPTGTAGADKITFFEDTDGDGSYDSSTDAITGLNIATSVAFGRQRIWVLNPPYLLAYPDPEGDGLPNGDPTIHLTGFGLEDTHAVANSLRWGPDGWLYGATGSTVTSDISSSATKSVRFQGQGVWRYHPETEVFELFSEGGGNTFHLEIDAKGRIYSGDNGAGTRGQYYKQGAYYVKNWGKHGALTNPYAFGYLKNMKLDGDVKRFTHAWIKYEGNNLPESYQHKLIAINPLLSYLQLSELVPNGSTFKTVDLFRLLETSDHWFRPVDIKVGPDGAVYLADWYDSRLSHVDPNDTWHKNSGRIYRISGNQTPKNGSFDLSSYSNAQLIELLSHPNKWHRQQAIRQFGDRKDPSVISHLVELVRQSDGQLALEALWATQASGGFDQNLAQSTLFHKDPFVRMWTVRFIGDTRETSKEVANKLVLLAREEDNPEVLSQLACSAKRLPPNTAIPILKELLKKPSIEKDPDNPLLIWWALEQKIREHTTAVAEIFREPQIWELEVVQQTLLERLSQRLVMEGGTENMISCANILKHAPDESYAKPVLNGILLGLRGRNLSDLSPQLIQAMEPFLENFGNVPFEFPIRKGNQQAIDAAIAVISNEDANVKEQLAYIELFGTLTLEQSIPVLIDIMENQSTRVALRQASLRALTNFDHDQIGIQVASAYPDKLRADPSLRMAALDLLTSRTVWTSQLIELIDKNKQVKKEDVPPHLVVNMQLLGDSAISRSVSTIWPELEAVSLEEKQQLIKKVKSMEFPGTANLISGQTLYQRKCGNCHKLYGDGGGLGPDLTGYDRNNLNYLIINIIDPSIEIREGYVNYKITTNSGRIITGMLTDRSSELVKVKTYEGQETVIPMEQIVELEAQPRSLMPERLLNELTDQQLRDLFAYIMKNE